MAGVLLVNNDYRHEKNDFTFIGYRRDIPSGRSTPASSRGAFGRTQALLPAFPIKLRLKICGMILLVY